MYTHSLTPLFDLAPRFQVSRCPPLLYGAVLSSSALSTLAIWCRIVRFRDVHPCYMVPYCPVPRCPVPRFQRPRLNINQNASPGNYSRPILSQFFTPHSMLSAAYLYTYLYLLFCCWFTNHVEQINASSSCTLIKNVTHNELLVKVTHIVEI